MKFYIFNLWVFNLSIGYMIYMYKVYFILNFFLKFIEFDFKEIGLDVSIGDILLWVIIFNWIELVEICWLREKDYICKEKK